jgi:hypothetical protein
MEKTLGKNNAKFASNCNRKNKEIVTSMTYLMDRQYKFPPHASCQPCEILIVKLGTKMTFLDRGCTQEAVEPQCLLCWSIL